MRLIAAAGLVLAFLAGPCLAQSIPLPVRLPDAYYTRMAELAREGLPIARMSNGKPVGAESAQDRAKPVLPADAERRIIDTGVVSGLALWCGLDWTDLFKRMMAAERARKTWSEKQLAYIGLLHGMSQGTIENSSRNQGQCNATDKANMTDLLARTSRVYGGK